VQQEQDEEESTYFLDASIYEINVAIISSFTQSFLRSHFVDVDVYTCEALIIGPTAYSVSPTLYAYNYVVTHKTFLFVASVNTS